MIIDEISSGRIVNQQLSGGVFSDPSELLLYMGALQAQDFPMSKWAAGIRLLSATEASVEEAVDNGSIIRTHVLRPTWHLVAAENVWWMLELTAPHIKNSMASRNRQLGLTEEVTRKCYSLIGKLLTDNDSVERNEITLALEKIGIYNDDNRVAHILLLAELDGLMGSGKLHNGKHTYRLLEKIIPRSSSLPRDIAVAKLAVIYFSSRGPATAEDFAWWSGLPAKDVRRAISLIEKDFLHEKIDSLIYWFKDTGQNTPPGSELLLLPAFDEMVISYKDRSALIQKQKMTEVISKNGMFWPVILYRGFIAGLWKRTIKNNTVLIEGNFFRKPAKGMIKLFMQQAKTFGDFLQKTVIVKINNE